MDDFSTDEHGVFSVIVPASNEARLIERCLESLLASEWSCAERLECIVVANGCRDDTAARARSLSARFAERGWRLVVLDLPQGGKPGALNAGDAQVRGDGPRAYLDADVVVSPGLLQQLAADLSDAAPRYASGQLEIVAEGWVSRAYARFWRRVPFMRNGVPGCGLFAVNAAGRTRWTEFPPIISDDTFVRLCFAPTERHSVPAPYRWPIAEGFGALVRVRRRQDAGVAEVEALYPALPDNDDKLPFGRKALLTEAARAPLGFLVYAAVALAVRLTRKGQQDWSRGR